MIARLLGRTGRVAGKEFVIGDRTRIGASPTNEIRIVADAVSRSHAQIVREGDLFWIEDLRSTNGTFLNGQRLHRERLRHLDVVTLGRAIDLIFVSREGGEAELPQPAVLEASLELLDGPEAGTTVEIPRGEIRLGRADACTVVFDSRAVSTVHALIQRTPQMVTIQDLESKNGTFVNRQRITQPTVLAGGDVVSLGGVRTIRVAIEMRASAAAAPLEIPTTPGLVFDQEWKTRLVWSPEEMAAFEATRLGPAVSPPPLAPAPSPSKAAPAPRSGSEPQAKPSAERPPEAPKAAPPAPASPAGRPLRGGVEEHAKPPAERPREAPKPPAAAERQPAVPQPRKEPPAPAPAAVRMVRLSGESGTFVARPGITLVGRAEEAQLRIDNREVSRRHARITIAAGTVTIEDLKSANGTSINGARLEPERPQPLRPGDRVAFGGLEFLVEVVT